jgi:hypothetical protein
MPIAKPPPTPSDLTEPARPIPATLRRLARWVRPYHPSCWTCPRRRPRPLADWAACTSPGGARGWLILEDVGAVGHGVFEVTRLTDQLDVWRPAGGPTRPEVAVC